MRCDPGNKIYKARMRSSGPEKKLLPVLREERMKEGFKIPAAQPFLWNRIKIICTPSWGVECREVLHHV